MGTKRMHTHSTCQHQILCARVERVSWAGTLVFPSGAYEHTDEFFRLCVGTAFGAVYKKITLYWCAECETFLFRNEINRIFCSLISAVLRFWLRMCATLALSRSNGFLSILITSGSLLALHTYIISNMCCAFMCSCSSEFRYINYMTHAHNVH